MRREDANAKGKKKKGKVEEDKGEAYINRELTQNLTEVLNWIKSNSSRGNLNPNKV